MHKYEEAVRCLLCEDAPCTKACGKGDVARAIRAIRFDNEKNAWRWVAGCTDDDLLRAEQACIHYDRPIRIRELLTDCTSAKEQTVDATQQSLGITFCGIDCENPFFLASSAVCTNYDMVARAFEAGWAGVFYKTICKQAGCDAIELNFSCPQMRLAGMGSDIGQDPELVNFYTSYVKRSVKIPVIPKMTPNITQMTRPAMGAYFAGADAISAINTIKSVTMSKEAEVSGKQTLSGYSGQAVKPIALRFILEMSMDPVINGTHGRAIELSGIGGIETWRDAVDFIQLGCRNVQVCTAVMQYGYRIIDDLVSGLQTYLTERGFEKLDDLVGEQLSNFVRPSDLDRDTMVYPKVDRELCIGCGRCYISCMDGGHQAIAFEERQPRIVGTKCVGCHLCRLVCPTGAIGLTKRIPKKR